MFCLVDGPSFAPPPWGGGGISLDRPGVLLLVGCPGLFSGFLTESLILAQDERWRRA